MANAAGDKLKMFFLRHGEKLAIGLSGTLFLAFVALAIVKPTINIRPEDLDKAAESAESNLKQRQDSKAILEKIASDGVKDTDFASLVNKQLSTAIDPKAFAAQQKWVTPEPGAGLIRDQPELIAPEQLYAFPGRGGLVVFQLDENGKKIPEDGKDAEDKAKKGSSRSRRKSSNPYGGEMAGFGGQMTESQKKEAEKRRQQEEKRLKQSLAGKASDKAKPKTKQELDAEQAQADALASSIAYKETIKGYRWVAITGVLNNKKMKENWLAALKEPSIAYPNYLRIDAQRQIKQEDGTWPTAWENVNADENLKVLDNLPEVESELAPTDVIHEALVDPLPFLKAGYWSGVHVAGLVPKEKRELPKNQQPGMAGMMPGMGGGGYGGMMPGMMAGSGGYGGGEDYGRGMVPGMMGAGMMGPGMGGSGGYGMGMGMGAGGPADDMNFDKKESDEIMVRSLDFTVEPENAYRFRLRVVVVNPNRNRADVNPGVDVDNDYLAGPWSEPTDEVVIPADVAAYVLSKTPPGARRSDQITFNVISWDPEEGHTIVRPHQAGPGQIVGEYATSQIPSSDGTGTKNKGVDFNSRQVVLDTLGGARTIPPALNAGAFPFDVPAVSLLVRQDGSVVVRSQARDVPDPVRVDMENNYRQAIKDSGKKRELGMYMEGGGMGGYGTGTTGMMGPGMMGGGFR